MTTLAMPGSTSQRWANLFHYLSLLQQVVRAGVRYEDTGILVKLAETLEREFRHGPRDRGYVSAVAGTLVAIYDVLDARIRAAQTDAGGLPIVPGLRWNSHSPTAGLLEDIPPFSAIDAWVAACEPRLQRMWRQRRPIRRRPPPRPPVLPSVRGTPLPTVPRADILGGVIPTPEPGLPSDVSQWLDILGNGLQAAEFVLGLLELAAAEFAVGLLGTLLSIVAVPIAMYAMWDDPDKLAAANGVLKGFSEALESMWGPYSGRELADLERWPAIAYFTGQMHGEGTIAGSAAERGYRAGVIKANGYIRALERQQYQQGLVWLWAASHRFRDARGVRVEVLRLQGYPRARDGYRMDFN